LGQFREPIKQHISIRPPLTAREPAIPITPKREIEIEEELAKIEAEIDRDRKRPHKLMLKSKPRPPWTSPPE
jgi:hypothetical protein